MLNVIGYTRVSTDDQKREGVSLEQQEAELRSYCAARGLCLVGIEPDPAISATVPPQARPGFGRLLTRLAAGEAQGLAFCALDRLVRSTRDVLDVAARFDAAGWSMVSTQVPIDTTTPMGRCFLTIQASFAQLEREQTSARTSRCLKETCRQGRRFSRYPPYGKRLVVSRAAPRPGAKPRSSPAMVLVEDPDEQRVLREVVRMSAECLANATIAAALNAMGLRTRKCSTWNTEAVKRVRRSVRRSAAA